MDFLYAGPCKGHTTIICVNSMTTIYVIFYVFLNRNVTIREIKRIELQIALLNNKLEAQQGGDR